MEEPGNIKGIFGRSGEASHDSDGVRATTNSEEAGLFVAMAKALGDHAGEDHASFKTPQRWAQLRAGRGRDEGRGRCENQGRAEDIWRWFHSLPTAKRQESLMLSRPTDMLGSQEAFTALVANNGAFSDSANGLRDGVCFVCSRGMAKSDSEVRAEVGRHTSRRAPMFRFVPRSGRGDTVQCGAYQTRTQLEEAAERFLSCLERRTRANATSARRRLLSCVAIQGGCLVIDAALVQGGGESGNASANIGREGGGVLRDVLEGCLSASVLRMEAQVTSRSGRCDKVDFEGRTLSSFLAECFGSALLAAYTSEQQAKDEARAEAAAEAAAIELIHNEQLESEQRIRRRRRKRQSQKRRRGRHTEAVRPGDGERGDGCDSGLAKGVPRTETHVDKGQEPTLRERIIDIGGRERPCLIAEDIVSRGIRKDKAPSLLPTNQRQGYKNQDGNVENGNYDDNGSAKYSHDAGGTLALAGDDKGKHKPDGSCPDTNCHEDEVTNLRDELRRRDDEIRDLRRQVAMLRASVALGNVTEVRGEDILCKGDFMPSSCATGHQISTLVMPLSSDKPPHVATSVLAAGSIVVTDGSSSIPPSEVEMEFMPGCNSRGNVVSLDDTSPMLQATSRVTTQFDRKVGSCSEDSVGEADATTGIECGDDSKTRVVDPTPLAAPTASSPSCSFLSDATSTEAKVGEEQPNTLSNPANNNGLSHRVEEILPLPSPLPPHMTPQPQNATSHERLEMEDAKEGLGLAKDPGEDRMIFDSVHDVEGSIVSRLGGDLTDFVKALDQLSAKRHPWQMALVENVSAVVRRLWPARRPPTAAATYAKHMTPASRRTSSFSDVPSCPAWVELYGSIATKLAIPCSDVNVLVRGVAVEKSHALDKQGWSEAHKILASALRKERWVQAVELVPAVEGVGAPPALRVHAGSVRVSRSGGGPPHQLLSIDMTFDGPYSNVIKAAAYVQWLREREPLLAPLVIATKQLLDHQGLLKRSVGMHSYALSLVVDAFLRRRATHGASPSKERGHRHMREGGESGVADYELHGNATAGANERSGNRSWGSESCYQLGAAFVDFLAFLGRAFDPQRQGISRRDGIYELDPNATADDGNAAVKGGSIASVNVGVSNDDGGEVDAKGGAGASVGAGSGGEDNVGTDKTNANERNSIGNARLVSGSANNGLDSSGDSSTRQGSITAGSNCIGSTGLFDHASSGQSISMPLRLDPVYIDDPTHPFHNNVGRGCVAFGQVQILLSEALSRLQQATEVNLREGQSVLGAVFGTPHHDRVVEHCQMMWCPVERRPRVLDDSTVRFDPVAVSGNSREALADDESSTQGSRSSQSTPSSTAARFRVGRVGIATATTFPTNVPTNRGGARHSQPTAMLPPPTPRLSVTMAPAAVMGNSAVEPSPADFETVLDRLAIPAAKRAELRRMAPSKRALLVDLYASYNSNAHNATLSSPSPNASRRGASPTTVVNTAAKAEPATSTSASIVAQPTRSWEEEVRTPSRPSPPTRSYVRPAALTSAANPSSLKLNKAAAALVQHQDNVSRSTAESDERPLEDVDVGHGQPRSRSKIAGSIGGGHSEVSLISEDDQSGAACTESPQSTSHGNNSQRGEPRALLHTPPPDLPLLPLIKHAERSPASPLVSTAAAAGSTSATATPTVSHTHLPFAAETQPSYSLSAGWVANMGGVRHVRSNSSSSLTSTTSTGTTILTYDSLQQVPGNFMGSMASAHISGYPRQLPAGVAGLHGGVLARLDSDVAEMVAGLTSLTIKREPWVRSVVRQVGEVVRRLDSRLWVDVYGSLATGLCLPCSDVDLVVRGGVMGAGGGGGGSGRMHKALGEQLKREAWVEDVKVVAAAAVPVIKARGAAVIGGGDLIAVDLSFDGPEHRGSATADYVRRLAAQLPRLRPLVLVLKQLLVERGLNDPYSGGLSSYALLLMVTAVLMELEATSGVPDGAVVGGTTSLSLGVALVAFLHRFGHTFDPQRQGVAVNMGGFVQLPMLSGRNVLVVEDPVSAGNNVGRTCFGFAAVQGAFRQALQQVRRWSGGDSRISGEGGGSCSVLGSVFQTRHHADVVHLVASVWCPVERGLHGTPGLRSRGTAH